MRRILSAAAILAAIIVAWTGVAPANAQSVPKSLEEGGTDSALKVRKNQWTIGIAGGLLSGTYMRFVDELAKALDDGDNLRILPIVSYGAASNMDDLLYLRGVDVAVTQSDVFEYFRSERRVTNLPNRVHYIIRLPISEVHLLARNEYKSMEDLRGKKVSFGPAGAGSSLTGPIIFQRLGIKVDGVNLNDADGLQKLRSGEIAALVRVIGKPIDYFSKIPADAGFRFLSIPFSQKFSDYYAVGELTGEDYPTLVPKGQAIDTIAVPTVLAVFNWPKGGDRHRRVERFVDRLFTNWEKFQKPPYHPKWRDVNLAATVPGWTRYFVADEMLKRMVDKRDSRDFQAFVDTQPRGAPRNDAEREALFREFMNWRDRQKR
jgi:TRAP-type uncharacterized transport system substrate-binding protein